MIACIVVPIADIAIAEYDENGDLMRVLRSHTHVGDVRFASHVPTVIRTNVKRQMYTRIRVRCTPNGKKDSVAHHVYVISCRPRTKIAFNLSLFAPFSLLAKSRPSILSMSSIYHFHFGVRLGDSFVWHVRRRCASNCKSEEATSQPRLIEQIPIIVVAACHSAPRTRAARGTIVPAEHINPDVLTKAAMCAALVSPCSGYLRSACICIKGKLKNPS